jgi:SH3 domain
MSGMASSPIIDFPAKATGCGFIVRPFRGEEEEDNVNEVGWDVFDELDVGDHLAFLDTKSRKGDWFYAIRSQDGTHGRVRSNACRELPCKKVFGVMVHSDECPAHSENSSEADFELPGEGDDALTGTTNLSRIVKSLYDYQSGDDVELSLKEGQVYVVLFSKDEWWGGFDPETGRVGAIPSNYVEEFAAPDPDSVDGSAFSVDSQRRSAAVGDHVRLLYDVTSNSNSFLEGVKGDVGRIVAVEPGPVRAVSPWCEVNEDETLSMWKIETESGTSGWICPGLCSLVRMTQVKSATKR